MTHLLLCTLLFAAGTPADSLPPAGGVLSLHRALELAETRHPSIHASRLRLEAARSRLGDASRRPNPTLTGSVENLAGSLGTERVESTLMLEQTFERGGDRNARTGRAHAEIALADAEFGSIRREILAVTTEVFLEAWTQQERVERLHQAQRAAAEAVDAAETRLRAGAAPRFERLRADGFLALREIESRRAEAALVSARRRLALQWNADDVGFDSLSLSPPAAPSAVELGALIARAEIDPELRIANADRQLQSWRLRESEAARVSDLSLAAGARHLREASGTGLLLGASIPLPLWNSGRGSVSAARLELDAATQRTTGATSRARESVLSAHDRFVASFQSWERTALRVQPAAQQALVQVIAAYRAGRISYVDIHDAQRSLIEADLLLIDATADAWRARQTLELLVGGSIDDPELRRKP